MKRLLSIFKLIVILSITFSVSSSVFGQIEKKEPPFSSKFNVTSAKQILDLTPNFDWGKIAEEDDVNHKQGNPLRVGLSVLANVNINNSGEWTKLSDGSLMWRLTLIAEGAVSLGLVFDEFELPIGSKLFVYGPSKQDVVGALGSHNNNTSRVLSTRLIAGNMLTIEYIEPLQDLNNSNEPKVETRVDSYTTTAKLNIGELIYAYTDAVQSPDNSKASPGESGSCQIDINCSPVGDGWQNEKRGVVHIVFKEGASYYVCTGSLINNTNEDATPYFLTANHCGGDASEADRDVWQFYFNFERPTCGSGTAPQNQTIIGCELISMGPIDGGSDFQLLLLKNNVPEGYAPYYNGWSRLTTSPASGASIHHPSGDVKKISTSNSILNNWNTVDISESTMPANSTWRVTWGENANGWSVTEGGSSGSPLFNQNGLIIGTLSGGSSTCSNLTATDYYGKFSYHWESNGSANSIRLSPWLDPTASGVNTLEGYDPYAIPVGEILLEESFEGSTFPPTGWTLQTAVTSNTWQESTGYSIAGDTPTPINPQDGEKFAYVQWQGAQDQNEWLISPAIDLTDKNELALSFYFNGSYHWSVTNDNCNLTLKARVNGGTWADLWTELDYTGWSDALTYVWNKVTIADLTAYEGQASVQFAFVYTGNDGANFNVDNITLYSAKPSGDTALLTPRNLSAELVNENDIKLAWSVPYPIGDAALVYYANSSEITNLNWSGSERATLFDITDFGLSYPAEITRLVHTFYEHEDYPWPNNNFQFKVYAFGNATPIYTSGLIEAAHLQDISHVLESPIMVSGNFYVSIVPVDGSGHPSTASKSIPTGTGHSYAMNSYGGWDIYDDGTNAYEFITSIEVASTAKISYSSEDYKHNLTSTIDLTKVAKIEANQLPSQKADGTLSGYKVYRNSTAIATINDPGTISYIDEDMPLGLHWYNVTALYSNPEGESLFSNTAYVKLTSVNSNMLHNVSMFPNPFQNSITINNAEQLSRMVVTNLIGQTLMDIPLYGSQTEHIPTNRLAKGVYLITVYGKNGELKVSKMIKE